MYYGTLKAALLLGLTYLTVIRADEEDQLQLNENVDSDDEDSQKPINNLQPKESTFTSLKIDQDEPTYSKLIPQILSAYMENYLNDRNQQRFVLVSVKKSNCEESIKYQIDSDICGVVSLFRVDFCANSPNDDKCANESKVYLLCGADFDINALKLLEPVSCREDFVGIEDGLNLLPLERFMVPRPPRKREYSTTEYQNTDASMAKKLWSVIPKRDLEDEDEKYWILKENQRENIIPANGVDDGVFYPDQDNFELLSTEVEDNEDIPPRENSLSIDSKKWGSSSGRTQPYTGTNKRWGSGIGRLHPYSIDKKWVNGIGKLHSYSLDKRWGNGASRLHPYSVEKRWGNGVGRLHPYAFDKKWESSDGRLYSYSADKKWGGKNSRLHTYFVDKRWGNGVGRLHPYSENKRLFDSYDDVDKKWGNGAGRLHPYSVKMK